MCLWFLITAELLQIPIMAWLKTTLALLLLTSSACLGQECRPGDNCKAPDCRCWDDSSIPGGLDAADTPQQVLISFDYGVNTANYELYTNLFKGLKNPNGCEPKGTFFVSKTNTEFGLVKQLSDAGHEIGMTTPDGLIPQDQDQWQAAFREMKAELVGAGIPEAQIQGSRGPELYAGGNDQFGAISDVGLGYDSTCVSIEYRSKENLKWPYTYDFVEGTPDCTIGKAPTQSFPGKWQFLVADIEYKGQKCASPSACSPLIQTSQDAFDMLYEAFGDHFGGKRTPYLLYLNPQWLTIPHQREGTRQFLDFLMSSFDDTWILTTQQSLAWMKEPVSSGNTTDFNPWACV
ncbi:chitin deacetylase 7 [Aplysia californica]|uniref:Chitin deacetylase 7 n=1 Tax=Aplysia californica TaxID=6500 RepID=A0ABM0K4H9_APLCA|nr:chitin deacetylase 7 [Aplysia californica]